MFLNIHIVDIFLKSIAKADLKTEKHNFLIFWTNVVYQRTIGPVNAHLIS